MDTPVTNAHEIYLLLPEISMGILAATIIIIDLISQKKNILPIIATFGLIFPLYFSIQLSGTNEFAFSRSIIVDEFGLFFKYLIIVATAIVFMSSNKYATVFGKHQGEYYALIILSATGMMLLSSAVELITIYIALELTALPMAALVAFIRIKKSAESGVKFLILSAFSSAFLLYGMVLIYGFAGTTYLLGDHSLSTIILQNTENPDLVFGGGALLLAITLITVGFAFKISAVPFHMWAPDVYEGAPTPITGYLSVASKAAGFAILLRILYTSFDTYEIITDWSMLIAVMSALSMTLGNLIAIQQTNIKRLLAYSTIAQAGYIMIGLSAVANLPGGEDQSGPAGILFYLAGYLFTNLAAFSVIIVVSNNTKSEKLTAFNGLSKINPFLSAIMALSMISLIGIPPTVGFMSKIYIFSSAIDTGLEWLVFIGVINSVISAYYYLKILKAMYIEKPDNSEKIRLDTGATLSASLCVLGIIIFGVFPGPLINIAHNAVSSIIN